MPMNKKTATMTAGLGTRGGLSVLAIEHGESAHHWLLCHHSRSRHRLGTPGLTHYFTPTQMCFTSSELKAMVMRPDWAKRPDRTARCEVRACHRACWGHHAVALGYDCRLLSSRNSEPVIPARLSWAWLGWLRVCETNVAGRGAAGFPQEQAAVSRGAGPSLTRATTRSTGLRRSGRSRDSRP